MAKFCENCGSEIKEGADVCLGCGKSVGGKRSNLGDSYGRPVSKVGYCLLAFFLGGLGIHKFYAGKSGIGVVYLLFCWTGIPAFCALIDFIIGLCKPSDQDGNIYFN